MRALGFSGRPRRVDGSTLVCRCRFHCSPSSDTDPDYRGILIPLLSYQFSPLRFLGTISTARLVVTYYQLTEIPTPIKTHLTTYSLVASSYRMPTAIQHRGTLIQSLYKFVPCRHHTRCGVSSTAGSSPSRRMYARLTVCIGRCYRGGDGFGRNSKSIRRRWHCVHGQPGRVLRQFRWRRRAFWVKHHHKQRGLRLNAPLLKIRHRRGHNDRRPLQFPRYAHARTATGAVANTSSRTPPTPDIALGEVPIP